MNISKKIPIIVSSLAVAAVAATGLLTFVESEEALEQAALQQLQGVQENRVAQLTQYLEGLRQDVDTLSDNEMVVNAIVGFSDALSFTDIASVRATYVEANPHPVAERHKLVTGDGSNPYDAPHGRYHPWFVDLMKKKGYQGVLLVDENGTVIYSASKREDFGADLTDAQWRDTGLGQVYQMVMENFAEGAVAVTDIARYPASGNQPTAFIAGPIANFFGGKEGALILQMPIERINGIMRQAEGMGETGDTYIVGGDGLMRSDTRLSETSTILSQSVETEPVRLALSGQRGVMIAENYRGQDSVVAYAPFDWMGLHWAVIAEKEMAEVDKPVIDMARTIALAGAIIAFIVSVIGLAVARSVTGPISAMTAAMQRLAADDLEVSIPAQGRKDEVGAMADALEVFKEHAVENRRLEQERAETERRAKEERRRMMNDLADQFDKSVGEVVDAVTAAATEMESAAQSMSGTAEETTQRAGAVAAASEQASANVQTVATATEELSSSIAEIGRQAQQSSHTTTQAVTKARQANEKVHGLANAADRIGEVVTLITDIAEQTNLLALNATIEAARAGNAGKGFAVVANEVKTLARQTSKATEDIRAQINAVQGETQEAVKAIEEIVATIEQVNEAASTIASAVEQQNAATQEIARNVQEASVGTENVSTNIQHVNAVAAESNTASDRVVSSAKGLAANAERLRAEVERFLAEVRQDEA